MGMLTKGLSPCQELAQKGALEPENLGAALLAVWSH